MTRRRTSRRASSGEGLSAAPFRAAAACYAANCALGIGVATGVVRTGRWHWVHHALYIATTTTTALAVGLGALRGARSTALELTPALIPLAIIPYAGTRTLRHPAVALSAAPFYALAVLSTRRRPRRRR